MSRLFNQFREQKVDYNYLEQHRKELEAKEWQKHYEEEEDEIEPELWIDGVNVNENLGYFERLSKLNRLRPSA